MQPEAPRVSGRFYDRTTPELAVRDRFWSLGEAGAPHERSGRRLEGRKFEPRFNAARVLPVWLPLGQVPRAASLSVRVHPPQSHRFQSFRATSIRSITGIRISKDPIPGLNRHAISTASTHRNKRATVAGISGRDEGRAFPGDGLRQPGASSRA